ncbi:hypothetical protein CC78DRAFT_613481 [Lojkania enalia]|uniref:Uncharacterized protein n=1 Tax=Lojkania enalia TaxID=147567 RepID=A0A9P4N717_9PLEO|nr:hypothetical protein CC78DRAFT_613481 [Didymosphaeria enalia]
MVKNKTEKPKLSEELLKKHKIIFDEVIASPESLPRKCQDLQNRLLNFDIHIPEDSKHLFENDYRYFVRSRKDGENVRKENWSVLPPENTYVGRSSYERRPREAYKSLGKNVDNSRRIAMEATKLRNSKAHEPRWMDFFKDYFFRTFEQVYQDPSTEEERTKRWALEENMHWDYFSSRKNPNPTITKLTGPKPDLTYGFPILESTLEDGSDLFGNSQNFSLNTLGRLRYSISNDLPSAPAKSLLSTPGKSLPSTPTKSLLSTPTKSLLSTSTNSLLSTPTKSLLSTPTNSLLSTPTKSLLSTPTNSLLSTPTNNLLSIPTNNLLSTPTKSLPATPANGLPSTPTKRLDKWTPNNTSSRPGTKKRWTSKDLLCYPWAIVEAKHGLDDKDKFCYCQAANGSACALELREALAVAAGESKYKVILAFTCIGPTVRLWLTFRNRRSKPKLIRMVCIWATSMELTWGVMMLQRVVQNMLNWAFEEVRQSIANEIAKAKKRWGFDESSEDETSEDESSEIWMPTDEEDQFNSDIGGDKKENDGYEDEDGEQAEQEQDDKNDEENDDYDARDDDEDGEHVESDRRLRSQRKLLSPSDSMDTLVRKFKLLGRRSREGTPVEYLDEHGKAFYKLK